MECSNSSCSKAFCYNICGDDVGHEDAPEMQPCVTVPRDMADSRGRAFRCPECLKDDQPLTMDVSSIALLLDRCALMPV